MANPMAFVATQLTDAVIVEAARAGIAMRGPENERYLRSIFGQVAYVVVATGGDARFQECFAWAIGLIPESVPTYCLGRTKDGSPRHPSRLAYATPREVWERPSAAGERR